MSRDREHQVMIQRRGRSHRATCRCGWSGHVWNDLRPAEADAWEHLFGDKAVVDASKIPAPDGAEVAAEQGFGSAGGNDAEVPSSGASPSQEKPERIVARARALAGGPSPYGGRASHELRVLAAGDADLIRSAISELVDLLALHSRRSASTADGEWLELITAKRLLEDSLSEDRSLAR